MKLFKRNHETGCVKAAHVEAVRQTDSSISLRVHDNFEDEPNFNMVWRQPVKGGVGKAAKI
jgi:hypothetical protein